MISLASFSHIHLSRTNFPFLISIVVSTEKCCILFSNISYFYGMLQISNHLWFNIIALKFSFENYKKYFNTWNNKLAQCRDIKETSKHRAFPYVWMA